MKSKRHSLRKGRMMALVNWENNYSVNINKIDEQHKSWINLINYLHEAMKAGKAKEVLGDILDEVMNYTVYHFTSEEKLFEQYNFPNKVEHKKIHDEFVQRFKKIKQEFENGKNILSIELMTELKNWLTNHILNTDKEYSSFLNNKGVN